MIEANMTKNWAKSMRTTHNNFIKRDSSASSKKNTMRVQSALPLRQTYKNQSQIEEIQCEPIMNEQPSMINANMVKDKSYFNDQTTCVTHSQSYF